MNLSPALFRALAEVAKDLPGSAAATLVRVLAHATPQDQEAALRRQAGLSLSQQHAVDRLMRQWQSETPPPAGAALASALEAMCTYDRIVGDDCAEVVWTGPRHLA